MGGRQHFYTLEGEKPQICPCSSYNIPCAHRNQQERASFFSIHIASALSLSLALFFSLSFSLARTLPYFLIHPLTLSNVLDCNQETSQDQSAITRSARKKTFMSDGSNSSHSTVEDATMASPQPSLQSGTSTPALLHSEAENLTTATPMDQDTPSNNQTPTQAPTSTMASPAGTNSEQQLQAASPSISAPMTPTHTATPVTATGQASSSMAGVVSTSTPSAPFSTSDTGASSATSTTTPLPSKGTEVQGVQTQPSASSVQSLSQQQQQQQQQHLLLLQKQAQEQAHLAQLQQAQASATASVAQHNLAVGAALQSRKEEELNRKDRTLAEFLPMMESYNPIVSERQMLLTLPLTYEMEAIGSEHYELISGTYPK